jgi:hypothetical protein
MFYMERLNLFVKQEYTGGPQVFYLSQSAYFVSIDISRRT